MRLLFFIFCSLFIFSAWADSVATGGTATAGNSTTTYPLPRCVDSEADITAVKEAVKANKNSKEHKYNVYKEKLGTDTDDQLLLRLVYAETKAANCADKEALIAPFILETIKNRMRIREGDIKKVIFEYNQFASSLNIYSSSHYREFLCPKDTRLWQLISKKHYSSQPHILPLDTVHYYLFKHDEQFKVPPWADGEKAYLQPENTELSPLKDCIRFYLNPNWK